MSDLRPILACLMIVALFGAWVHLQPIRDPVTRAMARGAADPASSPGGYLAFPAGTSPSEAHQPGRTTVLAVLGSDDAHAWDVERALLELSMRRPDVAVRVIEAPPSRERSAPDRPDGEAGARDGRTVIRTRVIVYAPTGHILADDVHDGRAGSDLLAEWLARQP